MSLDLISGVIGLILTLMIFSYLIGDSPLFRIAVYIFVGVSAGYAAAVVWHQVLVPKLFRSLQTTNLADPIQLIFILVPFVLCISLLTKLSPRIAWIGNFAMAVLVGVGAAAAVGGALLGTLIPQARASMAALDFRSATSGTDALLGLVEGTVMLAGTTLTLASFHFSASRAPDGTAKRNRILEIIAWVGRLFIAITLGVLFAGVYTAALTAMIERLGSIINFIRQLIGL